MASPLEFFPSKVLTLYLGRMFAVRIVAVLLMLVLILQMLDLLGESGKILAPRGNSEAQIWASLLPRGARILPLSPSRSSICRISTSISSTATIRTANILPR